MAVLSVTNGALPYDRDPPYLSGPVDGRLTILALLLKGHAYRRSRWTGALAELARATRKLELLSTKFVL